MVSVSICMFWSIDTYRYARLVSRHRDRYVVVMPDPDTDKLDLVSICQDSALDTDKIKQAVSACICCICLQIQADMRLRVC